MNVKVMAPAKINLMLDITGKQNNGYHTLTTIMQSISLSDIITITINKNGIITVQTNNTCIPSNEDNIAYTAAKKFIEYTNVQHNGINIHIQKNIPSEAGLGGGSTDAAAVLVGLNYIYSTNLSTKQLCDIGVTIGADVPFCIVGGTKLCHGIGEIIENTSPLINCYIVIAKGNLGISTKEAFKKIDEIGFNNTLEFTEYDGSIKSIKKIGYNKFEVITENSDIKFIKKTMMNIGAEYSAMSGSGSAVFGLFSDKSSAQKCIDILRKSGFFSTLCYPISNGPTLII